MAAATNAVTSWVPCPRQNWRSSNRNPPPSAATRDYAQNRPLSARLLSNGSRGYIGLMPTSLSKVRVPVKYYPPAKTRELCFFLSIGNT